MSSVYYAVYLLAVLVIIRWYVVSEANGANAGGRLGFLAMRTTDESESGENTARSVRETDPRFGHRRNTKNTAPKPRR
jgi:hypothetical protein